MARQWRRSMHFQVTLWSINRTPRLLKVPHRLIRNSSPLTLLSNWPKQSRNPTHSHRDSPIQKHNKRFRSSLCPTHGNKIKNMKDIDLSRCHGSPTGAADFRCVDLPAFTAIISYSSCATSCVIEPTKTFKSAYSCDPIDPASCICANATQSSQLARQHDTALWKHVRLLELRWQRRFCLNTPASITLPKLSRRQLQQLDDSDTSCSSPRDSPPSGATSSTVSDSLGLKLGLDLGVPVLVIVISLLAWLRPRHPERTPHTLMT